MAAKLTQSQNVLIGQLCVRKPADTNGFGNEKAVLCIVLGLAEKQVTYGIRLNWVDNVDLKALVKQETVHA